MEGTSLKELWMLLGEKDVQIYELLKKIEILTAENESLKIRIEDMELSKLSEDKANG